MESRISPESRPGSSTEADLRGTERNQTGQRGNSPSAETEKGSSERFPRPQTGDSAETGKDQAGCNAKRRGAATRPPPETRVIARLERSTQKLPERGSYLCNRVTGWGGVGWPVRPVAQCTNENTPRVLDLQKYLGAKRYFLPFLHVKFN